MQVVMLGPPGSGKGTQSARLADALGVPHVVSSDLIRQGLDALEQLAAGDLVDDAVVVGLVRDRLAQPDAERGFVLDGFPRDVAQAAALDDWLTGRGRRLDDVLLLEVARGALLERLAARALTEDRVDDDAATVAHRLAVYDEETAPLAAHYDRSGLLREVAGDGTVDEVAARVAAAVGVHRERG